MDKVLTIFNQIKHLANGNVYLYSRPINSKNLDIVINDDFVDIHSPNIIDSTYPNLQEFKETSESIKSELGFLHDAILSKNQDGNWYASLSHKDIDDVFVDVEMFNNVSIFDGYGGSVVSNELVWSGSVGVKSVGSNYEYRGNQYNVLTTCEFIVPDMLKVNKNSFFVHNGVKYVVDKIVDTKIYVSRKN